MATRSGIKSGVLRRALFCAACLLWAAGAAFALREADVLDFGAVPGDGLDDSVAFQQALDYLMADGGGYLYIPAGEYRIDRCLSVWASGTFGDPANTAGRIPLQIRGAGAGQSVLAGSDRAGMLRFQTNKNEMNLTVRDLSLLADAPDCGPALSVINPELGVRPERGLLVERVEIGRTAATNGFAMGIYTRGQWRALVSGVDITGADRLGGPAGPPDTVFDEQFFIDGTVRSNNSFINKADVGSDTNRLALTRLQFAVAQGEAFSSPRINILGGPSTGVGALHFPLGGGPDSVVSIACNDLDRRDTLALEAELSAYDTQGMAIGFGNDAQGLFSAEAGDAVWVESAGGTNTATNADLSLHARRNGATTVLETIAAHDRTGAANDTVALVLDRKANTLTASWLDGNNGAASFQAWSLGGIFPDGPPQLGLAKYEVRGQAGVHGNFPRIAQTRLTARSPYRMVVGIDFEGFYGGAIVGCAVRNAHTAFDYATDGVGEGCTVLDSFAGPCRIGLSTRTPGQEPGGHIARCHIVAEQVGVRIDRRRVFRVAGNTIEPAPFADSPFTDIELVNSQAVRIGGNRFAGSPANRIHLLVDGHGSGPLPIGAVRSHQIGFYENELALPLEAAVQYRGPRIFEVRLEGNTVSEGGAR